MQEGVVERLVELFEEHIPFNRWLGMRIDRVDEQVAVLRIPFRDELVGDPVRPAMHGGVLSTLADTAGGLAVFARVAGEGGRASTVDLRIDYLRPAALEDLVCEARVLRLGNRVAVTRMTVVQGDRTVAEAHGVYNLVRGT